MIKKDIEQLKGTGERKREGGRERKEIGRGDRLKTKERNEQWWKRLQWVEKLSMNISYERSMKTSFVINQSRGKCGQSFCHPAKLYSKCIQKTLIVAKQYQK